MQSMGRVQRRDFVTIAGSLLAALHAGGARSQPKVARIGYLVSRSGDGNYVDDAFRAGLRELGWVAGRNLVFELRNAGGMPDRLAALAAELVAIKPDVIVTSGTTATLAARQATSTIPIVFPAAGDPVSSGLVGSLARPGGNVTGLSLLNTGLVGKRLELIKQAVPALDRAAVLWHPGGYGERTDNEVLKAAGDAARALGVQLQLVEARSAADFDRAFADMIRQRAGALVVAGGGLFNNSAGRLVDLAARHRLPAAYPYRAYVEAGGLMAYGPDIADSYRRAATYVDKILKGAKPVDLPVEQPTRFELVINLSTAKTLGVTLAQTLLARADELVR
jgi:putative ABC transport system substrate-binding protein